MAINTYERKGGIDSTNVDIEGATQNVDISQAVRTGIALDDAAGIETEPVFSTKQLDDEAFMHQPLEIHMHEAASEDEPQFAEVTVNGVYRLIVRGQIATVPRAHVAVLANAKQQRLVQTKIVNPDGSMGYQEKAVLRLVYPFSVIHDPAGKRGSDWLRQLLRNPT
jgi:hypothetical protein